MDEPKTRSSNPSDYGYTYLTPRDQPPPEVGWKDNEDGTRKGVVNLYSQNVVKEGETTDSVNRESIANLSTTKEQWESIFSSTLKSPEDDQLLSKKKVPPKWEVKLPVSARGGGGTSDLNSRSLLNVASDSISDQLSEERGFPQMDMDRDINSNDNKNTYYDKHLNSSDEIESNYESAIEYEIRIAHEREEMLQKEKEERKQLLSQTALPPESSAKTANALPVLSSMEVVHGESESYQSAYNELAEADRAPDVWSMDGGVLRTNEADPTESFIDREIRLQREKEAELERQRVLLAREHPTSPVSSSTTYPPSLPDDLQNLPLIHSHVSGEKSPVQPGEVNMFPNQESRIARELREVEEREEEMRRLRESLQRLPLSTDGKLEPEADNSSMHSSLISQPPSSLSKNQKFQTASLQTPQQMSSNTPGTWQKEVSPFVSQNRRVSQDSASSHSLGKVSSDTATTPSCSVSVQPICDPNDDSDEDKPNFFQKQETPIEREMRIAKERENELRRMKGMPELSSKDDYYGSNSESPNHGTNLHSKPAGYHVPNQQSLKRISASRFQQEISALKERENLMRSEGKIISDSGEQIKPFKYMEVTGSLTVDGSEKRNFITKKGSPSAQEPQKVSGSEASQPPTAGVANKGLARGSKNFSYKEFRQTAESKIERELREMREREEELRNQRATTN